MAKKTVCLITKKNVFETCGEEIPEWFNGDGYYDDEMCVYNVGDRTYRDDVLYYSIEEMAEGEK